MSKYKGRIKKGNLVYVRTTWGNDAGKVSEDRLYVIRSIGPIQAILDPVDRETGRELYPASPGSRRMGGHTHYLENKDIAEERNREQEEASREGRNTYRRLYCWDWSQLFVPVGEAGWDADCNF